MNDNYDHTFLWADHLSKAYRMNLKTHVHLASVADNLFRKTKDMEDMIYSQNITIESLKRQNHFLRQEEKKVDTEQEELHRLKKEIGSLQRQLQDERSKNVKLQKELKKNKKKECIIPKQTTTTTTSTQTDEKEMESIHTFIDIPSKRLIVKTSCSSTISVPLETIKMELTSSDECLRILQATDVQNGLLFEKEIEKDWKFSAIRLFMYRTFQTMNTMASIGDRREKRDAVLIESLSVRHKSSSPSFVYVLMNWMRRIHLERSRRIHHLLLLYQIIYVLLMLTQKCTMTIQEKATYSAAKEICHDFLETIHTNPDLLCTEEEKSSTSCFMCNKEQQYHLFEQRLTKSELFFLSSRKQNIQKNPNGI